MKKKCLEKFSKIAVKVAAPCTMYHVGRMRTVSATEHAMLATPCAMSAKLRAMSAVPYHVSHTTQRGQQVPSGEVTIHEIFFMV